MKWLLSKIKFNWYFDKNFNVYVILNYVLLLLNLISINCNHSGTKLVKAKIFTLFLQYCCRLDFYIHLRTHLPAYAHNLLSFILLIFHGSKRRSRLQSFPAVRVKWTNLSSYSPQTHKLKFCNNIKIW